MASLAAYSDEFDDYSCTHKFIETQSLDGADRERFMPWRAVTGADIAPKGTPELETVLKGVFDRRRFLDLVKDFIVFGDTGSDVVKILAGYHQFHAVRHAVSRTLAATATPALSGTP